ncbi:hypothetical protein RUND412_000367 [Rhizina undulata]
MHDSADADHIDVDMGMVYLLSVRHANMDSATKAANKGKYPIKTMIWWKGPRKSPNPLLLNGDKKSHLFTTILYLVYIWCIKGAFIAMYFDTFPKSVMERKLLRRTMYFTSAYCIMTFVANILLITLACRPISMTWEPGVYFCYPFSFMSVLVTNFVTNITTDLLILTLPIIVLRTLKLKKSTLSALAFVTLIALVAMVAATLRFYFLYRLNRGDIGSDEPFQKTFAEIHSTITWTVFESWMVFFAFGLPPLRIFLRDLKTKTASLRSFVRHGSISQEVRAMKDSRVSTPSLEGPAPVTVETLELG